jgi:uncharacterized protein (TIGR02757 family)
VNTLLYDILESAVAQYNKPDFIDSDPISVPHRFSNQDDREIAGLFAALFSWGQRPVIIKKSLELMRRMDNAPADFVRNYADVDLKQMLGFVHRTFQETDLLYLLDFLQQYYRNNSSLEDAFLTEQPNSAREVGFYRLKYFHETVFSSDYAPMRTRKHVPTPVRGSSCKRLNMYLRWMVRRDWAGVDFGCWKRISPADLIMPMDLHVQRIATRLGLMDTERSDWNSAVELTNALKQFDPIDPVKYDFALFGMGVMENQKVLKSSM